VQQPSLSESRSLSPYLSSPSSTPTPMSSTTIYTQTQISAYDGFSEFDLLPSKNSTIGRSYADEIITDRGISGGQSVDGTDQESSTVYGPLGWEQNFTATLASKSVTTEVGEKGETEIGKTTTEDGYQAGYRAGYGAYSGLAGLSNYQHQSSTSPASSPLSLPSSSPLPFPSASPPLPSSPSSPLRQMDGGRDRGGSNISEEEPKDSELCKVCFDARINCVILPCGHLALCMNCCNQLTLCPCCRTPIQMAKLVYRA